MSWSYLLSGTCFITALSTWNFSPKLVRPVVCKPCYAPSSLIILILFKFLTISFVRFYLSNLWLSQSERVPIFGAFVRHLSRRVFPMVGHLSWKVFPGEGNFSLLNLLVIFCTILKKENLFQIIIVWNWWPHRRWAFAAFRNDTAEGLTGMLGMDSVSH